MLRLVPGLLLALSLPACNGPDEKPKESGADSEVTDSVPQTTDADGDGVTPGDGDCDDANAEVYPGVTESCDGVDNNCNGFVDEGLADTDADGTADCVDAETCDGVDNDGDGAIDEDFADADGNGVADCAGTEICDGQDNNADGQIDEGFDADGDGYTQCGDQNTSPDCDDADAAINPGADEQQQTQVDEDCDGMVDEGNWAPGDLAITEIMTNPDRVLDPMGEYIEIYNNSGRRLTLNGLIIESGAEMHQISTSDGSLIVLNDGEFYVLAINGDLGTNGEVPVGYTYSGISLSNESDDLSLWAGQIEIDRVVWDDGATMPDPSGASMVVDNIFYNATSNDDPDKWCVAVGRWDDRTDEGSPGEDNGLCFTTDHDGDGFSGAEGDCNDTNPTVYPGAFEADPALDNDCDDVVEWGPVAVAALNPPGTGEQCEPIYLDGSGSYDQDAGGTVVAWTWTLVSAPAGSVRTSADIINANSVNAEFHPDVPGDYIFSLTVNDGGTNSLPTTVTATIGTRNYNTPPVANAGSDNAYSSYVTCTSYSYGARHTCANCSDYDFTVDGSGSSDADGDDLTYTWNQLSGTYASVYASSGSSATIRFSGMPATYGSTLTDTATIELTVTDCMGAQSVAVVNLTHSCTGQ